MVERCTPDGLVVVTAAVAEAGHSDDRRVGTEHLLATEGTPGAGQLSELVRWMAAAA